MEKITQKKGFSLIEATVSIMILAIGLLAVMNFFPFAIKIFSDSQNQTIASNIALAKIEELRSLNYDQITVGTIETKQRISNDPSSYLYDYWRETTVQTIDSNFSNSATDLGLKKITVKVFWDSPISKNEKFIQILSTASNY
ncbi:MAG: prepilin-type N-terminal cleavage/methylation domain-containing protein [Candidatus Buchananbacteria bacterium]